MNTLEYINEFCDTLRRHALRKSKLYDGINAKLSPRDGVVLATEELGEIATAIVRDRDACICAEAIDLAHCALLIALASDPHGVFIKHVTRYDE